MGAAMEKTNQDIWNEALRTAELLRRIEPTLKPMEEVIMGTRPATKDILPVDYVADAQILTELLLQLKDRKAKVS
jgi:hypothetical protein